MCIRDSGFFARGSRMLLDGPRRGGKVRTPGRCQETAPGTADIGPLRSSVGRVRAAQRRLRSRL
eukprot:2851543-Pyramimonas_sp.AAC.1